MYSIYSKKLEGWVVPVRKISMLMRFTVIAILIAAMQASAAGYAQSITLSKKDATLMEVFQELRRQTDYDFVYSQKQLANARTISINVRNVDITDVLDQCFQNQPLIYIIENKTITIKEKPLSFIDKVIKALTKQTITGKVISASNQEPLPGAIIKITNTNDQTRSNQTLITNDRGEFTLNLPDGTYNLSVHYLSYKAKTLTISIPLQSPLVITLDTDEQTLQEVEINAGYYTVKEREKTGSISRITSKEIDKQPVNNVLQAMQANISGVQVTQTTGVPGGGFNIQIRGQNSIQQGNSPFYIVDGVPFTATTMAGSRSQFMTPDASPLASINPSDIESIEVLKDADATAIYGSRGANGVVLITTKKGTANKPAASLSVIHGISNVPDRLELMNTAQYLQMRNEAFSNDNVTPATNQFDINGTWSAERDVDWQEELIGGTAQNTNIQSSLVGSTGDVQFRLGAAYYSEGTVFPGDNRFNRGSTDFNLRYNSKNGKLNLSASGNYSSIDSKLFGSDLTPYILLPPNYPELLDSQGRINWGNNTVYVNPLAITQRSFQAKTNNLIGNLIADYKLYPDLQLKVSLGYTAMNRGDYNSSPLSSQSPAATPYGSESRISYFGNNSINTWIAEPQLTWRKRFGENRLDFLIGSTFQQSLTDGQNVKASGYNSDALMRNIASASILSIQERQYFRYRYTALFARLNYAFRNNYFLNITARRDGSSRFGDENRFANFGAIGAAWVLSDEAFFKKLSFVNFAKLRASYGITGSDQLADYGYLELWTTYTNTYQGISTISPNQISNPNYAWERNNKKEIALDLSFFKGKVTLSSVYYSNRSSSQLIRRQLAPSIGFSSIQDNLPAKISNSGWEFELTSNNIATPKIRWNTSINLTIPKTRLLEYPGLSTSSDAINYEIGKPLSILKVYNTIIDPATGLYTTEDYDKNGVIDNKDRYIVKVIGRRYFGGLQNSIQIQRFQFDCLFQFVKQQGNSYIKGFSSPGRFVVNSPTSNQPVEVLDHWKANGDNAAFQRFGTTSQVNSSFITASGQGGLAIEDSSFIRLKNAQLAYNVEQSLLNKISLDACQIFVQGQNLLTFTRFKGLDPETQNVANLPSLRVFAAGIKVTF